MAVTGAPAISINPHLLGGTHPQTLAMTLYVVAAQLDVLDVTLQTGGPLPNQSSFPTWFVDGAGLDATQLTIPAGSPFTVLVNEVIDSSFGPVPPRAHLVLTAPSPVAATTPLAVATFILQERAAQIAYSEILRASALIGLGGIMTPVSCGVYTNVT